MNTEAHSAVLSNESKIKVWIAPEPCLGFSDPYKCSSFNYMNYLLHRLGKRLKGALKYNRQMTTCSSRIENYSVLQVVKLLFTV